jgi:hypothetical protein
MPASTSVTTRSSAGMMAHLRTMPVAFSLPMLPGRHGVLWFYYAAGKLLFCLSRKLRWPEDMRNFRIGLWIVSGQICAGFCGPRYRWEEEQSEKRASSIADNDSETDAIPWNWREGTQLRVQEAFDFCLTVCPSSRWSTMKKEASDANQYRFLLPGLSQRIWNLPRLHLRPSF